MRIDVYHTTNESSRATENKIQSEKKFVKIPIDDVFWVRTQKPAVLQLFLDCWHSDPYGTRWMQLNTKLKKSAFSEAKKKLSDQGLFVFKPEPSIQDGRSTVCWMVKNLHGSRVKGFWKDYKAMELESTITDSISPSPSTNTELESTNTELESTNTELKSTNTELESTNTDSISPQTLTQSDSQNASRSFQDLIQDLSQDLIQEGKRENEQKYSNPEKEGTQQNAVQIKGVGSPQSPASLKDKLKIQDKTKDPQKDNFSGGAAAIQSQNSHKAIKYDWEVAPGEPYPAFIKWRAQNYIDQGGHWAKTATANAKSEIRNNPARGADLWQEFLEYSDRAANSALERKAAGIDPSLPPCFQETPIPNKENVAAKLKAIASPTPAIPPGAATTLAPTTPLTTSPATATRPEDGENSQAYQLYRPDAIDEVSMPSEIRAEISQLFGKRSMPKPEKPPSKPLPIFAHKPCLDDARKIWAIANPVMRDQIWEEIAANPHWDLEILDGRIQEIVF